jgi:predicted transcriptional regulator
MNLNEIATQLSLVQVTADDKLEREVNGCYAGDLLSCAMAGAKRDNIWLTVQSHANVVAVAVLLDLAAIVVTEGANVETTMLERANTEGVVVLTTTEPTYSVAGRLWELGIRNGE